MFSPLFILKATRVQSIKLTFLLAWRYFRARREQGLVSLVTGSSIAGLSVGVAALILSMAVFTGFRLELRQRVFDLEAPIKIQALEGGALQWRQDYSVAAQQVPGVTKVVPILTAPSIVFRGAQTRGALFRGMNFDDLRDLPFAAYINQGGMSEADDPSLAPAIMGQGLAQALGLSIGEEFRAYQSSGQDQNAAAPSLPSANSFVVVGLFQSGIEEVDQRLIYTTPAAARALTPLPEGPFFDGAQVYLDDTLDLPRAVRQLAGRLTEYALVPQSTLDFDAVRDGRLGFSAGAHLQLAQEQEAALIVILCLIVIVAAFGVVAAQIMKVQEKSREIAVLRSFGADARLILQVFLLLGLIIGAIGSCIGLGIGLLLAINLDDIRLTLEALTGLSLFPADQFRLAFLPSRPTASAAVLAVFMAIILTVLAVIYPAVRAARLSPAEALRYA